VPELEANGRDREPRRRGNPPMRSVFVPVTFAEAQKAIAVYDLAKLGIELIPIPTAEGCVIAIRELERPEASHTLRIRLPWSDQIRHFRAELQVRSILRTLSVAPTALDA
jgi:hypothetical protein